MVVLVLGLIVFLGSHSVRIFAEPWRARRIGRLGEKRWKMLYSLVSIVGLVLLVWGYGLARADPLVLWHPPLWARHLAVLLTVPVFILFAAAHIGGTHIKARVRHPMLVGVKFWAAAHLIANGALADVFLFGAFLLWAVFDFKAARARSGGRCALPGVSGFARRQSRGGRTRRLGAIRVLPARLVDRRARVRLIPPRAAARLQR